MHKNTHACYVSIKSTHETYFILLELELISRTNLCVKSYYKTKEALNYDITQFVFQRNFCIDTFKSFLKSGIKYYRRKFVKSVR